MGKRLPSKTRNAIIQNLTYNIDYQLEARMAKSIHMCLNHNNDVDLCRSKLSKLLCIIQRLHQIIVICHVNTTYLTMIGI